MPRDSRRGGSRAGARRRRFHLETLEPRLALDATGLRITELLASNEDGIVDFEGDAADWLEIHNPTDTPVDLGGLYLTDSANNLTKWQVPQGVTLEGGGYLVVFASSKNGVWGEEELHTNFALSADGEYLALVANDGVTVIDAFSPKFPRQTEDVSYGRSMVGGPGAEALLEPPHYGFFAEPTPGAANGIAVLGFTAEPTFSVPHGFYDEAQSVALATTTPAAIIAYTTDGSMPLVDDEMNVVNGTLYTQPVVVDGTTNIRARAFRDGWAPSTLTARSYLFLDDIVQQSLDGTPPVGWPASGVNGQVLDYGFDPEIIALYGEQAVKDSLAALSVFSLTFDMNDLFSPTTGIYVNAQERGREWERHVNVEYIDPATQSGFEVNAGLRIRGGVSRGDFNPKHSFRMTFRGEYGDGKLQYPMFGSDGAQKFDVLDLQTAQNLAWSYESNFRGEQNTFLRDIFSRDTQRALGQEATRGEYHHLFLNGVYWGIYLTQERVQEDFAATYFGGEAEAYDIVKAETEVHGTAVVHGSETAWRQLFDYGELLASDPVANADVYWTMQGLRPDGTRDTELPVLLDVDNLIDYMLVVFYTGGYDIALTSYNGNNYSANWLGLYNRQAADEGFQFFIHDNELSLGSGQVALHQTIYINRTGPFRTPNQSNFAQANPQYLHQDLLDHPEYRQRFVDHVLTHFFNDGALTTPQLISRFTERKLQVEGGIIAEAARWGDAKVEVPRTKATWDAELDWILGTYLPLRGASVLSHLAADDLHRFPAPALNQAGGILPINTPITIAASTGTLYYTLDGVTDPRAIGGEINAAQGALRYEGPIAIDGPTTVMTRVRYNNGNWSGLVKSTFDIVTLPGDYDQSGTVDADDYLVWKSSFGRAVAPYSGADGNGDGVINAGDYIIWRNHLGESLPPAAIMAENDTVQVEIDEDAALAWYPLLSPSSRSEAIDSGLATFAEPPLPGGNPLLAPVTPRGLPARNEFTTGVTRRGEFDRDTSRFAVDVAYAQLTAEDFEWLIDRIK